MSRWRILTVLALMVVPVVILAGYGAYGLWKDYWWGAWVWAPMTVAMAVGWFLAWYWQRNKTLLAAGELRAERPLDRARPAGLEAGRGAGDGRQGARTPTISSIPSST